jgi:hypothetical protein
MKKVVSFIAPIIILFSSCIHLSDTKLNYKKLNTSNTKSKILDRLHNSKINALAKLESNFEILNPSNPFNDYGILVSGVYQKYVDSFYYWNNNQELMFSLFHDNIFTGIPWRKNFFNYYLNSSVPRDISLIELNNKFNSIPNNITGVSALSDLNNTFNYVSNNYLDLYILYYQESINSMSFNEFLRISSIFEEEILSTDEFSEVEKNNLLRTFVISKLVIYEVFERKSGGNGGTSWIDSCAFSLVMLGVGTASLVMSGGATAPLALGIVGWFGGGLSAANSCLSEYYHLCSCH